MVYIRAETGRAQRPGQPAGRPRVGHRLVSSRFLFAPSSFCIYPLAVASLLRFCHSKFNMPFEN